MPHPPAQHTPRMRGFTLLELMVALVVIGVILASVQLNLFTDERRRLYQEGERLAAVLAAAADEAVMSGRPMGVRFDATAYTPLVRDAQGRWRAPADTVVYRSRALPEGVRIEGVRVDGRALPAGEVLAFPATGLRPPFEVRLALGAWRVRVQGDALGELRVIEEAQAA